MTNCTGYAATAADAPLGPFSFTRREPGPTDVAIDILYCGVCHSDLHTARNEWGNTLYPCLPGHEIVGRVTAVGKDVTRFKVGDVAAVGCMVDSCQECESCREGLEQFCDKGLVGTYNSPDAILGGHTFGGYSSHIVVTEEFVLRVPDNLDLAATAPLLCAGITTYSPLRHWGAGPGKKVGVVGLGGLGHMAVKLAHAMGAEVVLFTTSPSKVEDGQRLGAHDVVLSTDPDAMAAHGSSLDLIIDAVAAPHDINAYLALLKRDATLVQVGVPDQPLPVSVFSLIGKRRSFAGSLIGGIAETQEMLDFCGAHDITADIEMIPIQKIEEAYARMLKSDVKYRFVIDMASLAEAG
ncbi:MULTISPECIES: NAD(P)-dependent alcohol dehydrogenase [Actibacterium]|uniref:Putative zinc-type alcohol dehydrogenase-like protein n=1 Tax=Actibacterium naphthalenivorans TaxID=1614693 RepID=A0A840C7Y5_9RHOB|nr:MULTISPECIES: NAD(P)-dependent alcohol dehydrogenase [Actibacterium]ALG88934.1 hydroxyacid dehydrogenase [Actibacterium sp. EMB200-NS6]MBB4021535.1 putative zinc-type alcohol dehydrogenase-like protein [Actibacterium naphthalenivorans]